MQYFAGIEIGILKIFAVVGLEFNEGLDVGFDLTNHEVQLFDVVEGAFIFSAGIFLPDGFEELEMLGLVGDHHFLFIGLLLVMKADE